MSDRNQWMPLYVGDYLADTMHLTGAEHGAYMLLLMHSWRTGPLPDDDRMLAMIARTDAPAWKRMKGTVRAFFQVQDGKLVQARLERVRAEQGAKIEQRRAAGRASAEARSYQRNGSDRSTTVDLPLPPRAREPEPEEEKKEHPSQPSVGRSPRGSRLPPGWSPDAELQGFASGLGLDPDRVAANFRDYWHAKAGRDAVKLDWPATWRGWCRREAERSPARGLMPARPRDDAHARRSAAFDALADMEGLKL
jgi:uncharacterized protein YdaU (DUF1376 family)